MEDDSNSRFGLADDDEYAGFDIDAAIASLEKKTHLFLRGDNLSSMLMA